MPVVSHSSTRRLIRALRLRLELTQEELAEKAGLDYKYYQRLEIGCTEVPMLETLERLSKVLGVNVWLLLCDDLNLIMARTGLSQTELREADKRRPGRPKKKVG